MKQRRFRLRLGVLLGCILAVVVSSVAPAIAAPPEDDNIGSPVVIDSLPYQAVQDTSEATWADEDHDPSCLGDATVWYTFTPASDIGIDINTFGSDYDTTLGVFWGNPSDPISMSSFGATTKWPDTIDNRRLRFPHRPDSSSISGSGDVPEMERPPHHSAATSCCRRPRCRRPQTMTSPMRRR